MTSSELMNVVVFPCGRKKRWKRHSIVVFKQIQNILDEDYANENYSFRDLMSQSLYHKNANERLLSENNRDLHVIRRLAKSSEGITASDLELLRKSFIERFALCKEHSEKIYELKSAICAINEIKTYSRDLQWLAQYQYILNWCYCQMRFISDPAERHRLFLEVKEKYRKMFEMLDDMNDLDKLSSYLHWSQLCYQYAELVDQESLDWSIEAITNARYALSISSSSSLTSGSSISNKNRGLSSDNGNDITLNHTRRNCVQEIEATKAENRRRRKIATIELIESNVLKTENAHACFGTKRLKVIL